ncbi:hypothetical protein NPS01_30330 [Nocardioides psychrotolerans]|uniref:Lipoprotein n=1 Tax=Nocardioides psychrotolerans TaxID=1005945 RepID=A0A1I3GP50_9ACTN|nr:hypothetical protein [Nocardioides psychrotolerans]GEP39370.1 hypothetical protein NPS01_30330 [Nocardioides psychrotolerans]SFI25072.1 hypothetical protein SAMN05216561_106210 [Nocardioides psychrotolerans]
MTLTTRVLTSTALAALLSGSLVACGDDDPTSAADEPVTAALTADFCAALGNVAAAYGEVAPDDLTEEAVQAIKGTVTELVEVGTPDDMSDDAEEGFVLVTSEVLDLADDVTLDELEQAGEDFSGADEEKADAFDDYVDQTCDDASGEDE